MSPAPDTSGLWLPKDLAAYLHGVFAEVTLANWRCAGIGPPYIKVGHRVFYRPEAVKAWAKEQERGGKTA